MRPSSAVVQAGSTTMTSVPKRITVELVIITDDVKTSSIIASIPYSAYNSSLGERVSSWQMHVQGRTLTHGRTPAQPRTPAQRRVQARGSQRPARTFPHLRS